MRPDWDSYFMKIAYAVSERSTCDRAFVGCVLVLDKRILTTGFNGSPKGQPHCDEIGHLMVEGHCVRTIHAETNAIIQAALHGVSTPGCTCYVHHFPCINCTQALINAGIIVVGVGGGGIPVVESADGTIKGVDAVIDKDFGSSLLAVNINADLFVISTAVEKVALNFNTPDVKWLDQMTVAEAKQYIKEGHFKPGSMLPKVQAIIKYLEAGGKKALITDPEHIGEALDGKTGTWILP